MAPYSLAILKSPSIFSRETFFSLPRKTIVVGFLYFSHRANVSIAHPYAFGCPLNSACFLASQKSNDTSTSSIPSIKALRAWKQQEYQFLFPVLLFYHLFI